MNRVVRHGIANALQYFTANAMYIRPRYRLHQNIYAVSLSLGKKIHHVTSRLLQKEPWGKLEKIHVLFFKISTHLSLTHGKLHTSTMDPKFPEKKPILMSRAKCVPP